MQDRTREAFASLCAGGIVLLGLAALGALSAPQAVAGAVPERPAAEASPTSACVVTHTKSAGPPAVALGDAVDVTLTVRMGCVPVPYWMHVVLVLDGSAAMSGPDTQTMKQGAASLVRAFDLAAHPTTLVGVLEFADETRRLSPLTNDETALLRALNLLRRQGETHIELGIRAGEAMLRRGRAGHDPGYVDEVMVLFSQGHNEDGCEEALRASRHARGQGILVIAVCIGGDCDEDCMSQLASSRRYYFHTEHIITFQRIFPPIREDPTGILGTDLVVTDTLTDEMVYVPAPRTESAFATPQVTPGPPMVLVWREALVRADPVTYTFRARPQRLGEVATNLGAVGSLRDARRAILTWTFAVPHVLVFLPSVTPTPTHVPATATASATRTSRPPTATPAPPPRRIYVPLARGDGAP